MTLKEEVITRWAKGQSIARIQKEMMITINLFDKSLTKLNDAILKGRFEVLGMNGERPFPMTLQEKIEEWQREISDIDDETLDCIGEGLGFEFNKQAKQAYVAGQEDAYGNVLTLLRNEKINPKLL